MENAHGAIKDAVRCASTIKWQRKEKGHTTPCFAGQMRGWGLLIKRRAKEIKAAEMRTL